MTDAADASRQLGGPVAAATGQPERPFVGRVRELSELRAAPGTAAAPRGSLLLVTGTPGIGKSRLMEELARLLVAEGWRVLVGRCWEHGGAPAYWPWMQVVRAAGGELEACFPSTPPAADPETARFMLFDAVGRLLRTVADTGPVLVILDDLHAADEPSLLLLRFLAQTVTDERLVIVGAYRDVEPRVHELAEVFGDLVRVGRRLPLGGLSRPEVAAYIRSLAGRPPAEALAAVSMTSPAATRCSWASWSGPWWWTGRWSTSRARRPIPCCGSPRSCAGCSAAGWPACPPRPWPTSRWRR